MAAMSRRRGKGGGADSVPRLDAMSITGLHALMNPQNVDQSKSGEAAENEITGKSLASSSLKKRSEENPVSAYEQELRDLAAEIGVDLGDDDSKDFSPAAAIPAVAPPPPSGPKIRPATEAKQQSARGGRSAGLTIDPLIMSESESEEGGSGSSDPSSGSEEEESSGSGDSDDDSSGSEEGSDESDASEDEESEEGSEGSEDVAGASEILRGLEKELGIDLSESAFEGTQRIPSVPMTFPSRDSKKSRHDFTVEQERRRHIESVLGNLRDDTHTSFGAQREREQDIKANKLEQIGQLRLALEEDGINCSAVGDPTALSSIEEIDSVLRILRLKNDRNRCASLAEEVILGVAEMVETVFDGTRAIPIVGWKPDYTGYHNTVNVKMHRMRYETASVVSGIIEKHNLGPMARIGLELLPSLVLYPRQQRRQRSRPGLYNDPNIVPGAERGQRRVPDARAAYSAIRARDEVNRTMAGNNDQDSLMRI